MSNKSKRRIIICKRCGKERPNAAKMLCSPCYVRERYLSREPVACGRCERVRLPFSSGLCKNCYQVKWNKPDAFLSGSAEHKERAKEAAQRGKRVGEKSGRWDGGRFIGPNGYVRIINPDPQPAKASSSKRYLMEHRVVAEQMIGRPLKKGEVVHHVNLIKTDNRPSNLMVLPSISAHRQIHAHLEALVRDCEQRLRDSYQVYEP